MTTQEFIQGFEAITSEMLETMKAKNADYSCGPDPFNNFRMIERYSSGRISALDGLLVRMSDKMSRAINLADPTKVAQVKSEALDDTLGDLAVYSILCRLLLKDNKEEA